MAKINENDQSIDFRKYFDLKFETIRGEIGRLYEQKKEKDLELSNKIKQLEKSYTKLQIQITTFENKVQNNTEDIKEIERLKKIVDNLNTNISTISTKLETIEKLIDKKQKNTLTIAIAICSPFLTALIGALAWLLLYKPA